MKIFTHLFRSILIFRSLYPPLPLKEKTEEISNVAEIGYGMSLMKHFPEDNRKMFWMERLWINYPKGTEKAPY